jgi:hypothetical protein
MMAFNDPAIVHMHNLANAWGLPLLILYICIVL